MLKARFVDGFFGWDQEIDLVSLCLFESTCWGGIHDHCGVGFLNFCWLLGVGEALMWDVWIVNKLVEKIQFCLLWLLFDWKITFSYFIDEKALRACCIYIVVWSGEIGCHIEFSKEMERHGLAIGIHNWLQSWKLGMFLRNLNQWCLVILRIRKGWYLSRGLDLNFILFVIFLLEFDWIGCEGRWVAYFIL